MPFTVGLVEINSILTRDAKQFYLNIRKIYLHTTTKFKK